MIVNSNHRPNTSSRDGKPRAVLTRGMTLIELLVVIAIVGTLAGILLPMLGRGKRSALTVSCLSNLHQIGLAMEMYVRDNDSHLPYCSQMPSANPSLTPITVALAPFLKGQGGFQCPADHTEFAKEQTSYEWNQFLNGASYDRPEDWSPATRAIVEITFGGRLNTPLIGDAEPFHPAGAQGIGKNALFFDGRADREY